MKFSLVLLAVAAGLPLAAHDVITTKLTYTRDISRIFARRCEACHGEGASIPLTSYEQVRPWAVGIKEQVLSRAMPPWGAVKGFGKFDPDGGLTQEEIMIVAAWVVGGAPQGDAALLAPASRPLRVTVREFASESVLVPTRAVLGREVRVAGIRPLAEGWVASARLTATLPGGHREPLLWLYNYDARSQRTFELRTPLLLPAGTVVESTAPLQWQLRTAKDSLPRP